MKKALFVLLSVALLIPSAVFAQEKIDPEVKSRREEMLLDIETHFPRLLYSDLCDKHFAEKISEKENGVILTHFKKGGVWTMRQISPTPMENEGGYGIFYVPLDFGSYADFAIHIEMGIAKEYPSGTGGCFLQYTDREIVDFEKSHAVSVMIGKKIDGYTNTAYGKNSFDILDLSDYGEVGKMYKVDIIRLNGMSYFYIDGQFLAEYKDNFDSRFTWMAGPILFEGGEEVTCNVDNIVIRRK